MSTKSLAVAQYILDRCKARGDGNVTPMQLIKMAYLAQGWMLGIYGRSILDEQVAAWRYGPVVPSVYQAVKSYNSLPVQRVEGACPYPFDDQEKSILDQVADLYGNYSGVTLSSWTHQPGTPWDLTWRTRGQNGVISNDVIEAFYKEKYASHGNSSAGF